MESFDYNVELDAASLQTHEGIFRTCKVLTYKLGKYYFA